jgi:hypothetical protein
MVCLNKLVKANNYYNDVKQDYINNSNYFRNKAIIEGIRNAISHGNVTIENSGIIYNISDAILKFSDYYEGKLCFELEISVYEFESLFEKYNVEVANKFLHYKKRK